MLRSLIVAIAAGLLIPASYPLYAQVSGNHVTCSGTLIDVWLKPKDAWPLAVIYDERGKYTCAIDRGNAGHDPLQPCAAGDRCPQARRLCGERSYLLNTVI
jgi:hypothetical protein